MWGNNSVSNLYLTEINKFDESLLFSYSFSNNFLVDLSSFNKLYSEGILCIDNKKESINNAVISIGTTIGNSVIIYI